MYLEKLEIQGFKSFALPSTLSFQPGITAIVGPNGSGKSNVSDAVRWVLGEQSMKTLRGKKAEDVIFSGSDSRARLGMAEVAIYLNNEDGQAPIDYTELVITRRLYRNGESEYLLNKSKVRLQDVHLLLAKANFGQRSYSIVGQGMIDNILSASAQERKEFFDEATGVRQFQIKKDQAVNKLNAGLENLQQVETVVTEIEPRLKSLTRQVKRLEQREELEKDLQDKQQIYYGFLWQKIDEQYQLQNKKYQRVNEEKERKATSVETVQAELATLEQAESRSEIFDELQKQYQHLIQKKNEWREQELQLSNRIELLNKTAVTNQQLMPMTEVIIELEEALALFKHSDEPTKLVERFHEAQKKIQSLIKRLKNPADGEVKIDPSLIQNLEKLRAQITELNQELETTQREIQDFNKKEEGKKGKFFELQRKFQQETFAYNRLQGEVNEVKIELARLETKREDLETELKRELPDWQITGSDTNSVTNTNELFGAINHLKHQLQLIGAIDEETVTEYRETKERYDYLHGQATDLRETITKLDTVIVELDQEIKKRFNASFHKINEKFGEYFKVLFNGGKAGLMLQKQEEPTEQTAEDMDEDEINKKKVKKAVAGIEIQATPPGKKLQSISMLSGGERALTSIALICAIIKNNPSPFVILDEVDAALDESNSIRFASIIKELSATSQFIAITHNRYTMEYAKILYGVTMGEDGASKILSLNLEDAKEFDEQS